MGVPPKGSDSRCLENSVLDRFRYCRTPQMCALWLFRKERNAACHQFSWPQIIFIPIEFVGLTWGDPGVKISLSEHTFPFPRLPSLDFSDCALPYFACVPLCPTNLAPSDYLLCANSITWFSSFLWKYRSIINYQNVKMTDRTFGGKTSSIGKFGSRKWNFTLSLTTEK